MTSANLRKLSTNDRKLLSERLCRIQNNKCFICGEEIDLNIQDLDIDHVIPWQAGGRDNESNYALTHQICNRSKQASNLEVARILVQFSNLRKGVEHENREPNLGDVLNQAQGGNAELGFNIKENKIEYSLIGQEIYSVPVYQDKLSGFQYFFATLPIQFFRHDEKINPRSIGNNIRKLIEEFHQKRPQLHVSLGWLKSDGNNRGAIHIFDGQHKAAAQILLGAKELPVRVFIDPDIDILTTTNANAGTTLRQVAFDKSVQRHLGSTLYRGKIERFQAETNRKPDDLDFSEKDLVLFYKGQSREMKRYILDAVRDGVTSSVDNKLRDFIDFGGKKKERPLSYSTVDKTFYSFFVYQEVLETPLNHILDNGDTPRELETSQIVQLMNIIAETIYIDKFDSEIGANKIENKVQNGEPIPHAHLRALRMSKEEIIYNWLKYIGQIARFHFTSIGKPIEDAKLFQYSFPDQLWNNIRQFVFSLSELPIWVNKEFSETLFGGRQNYKFWQTVFETGKSPQDNIILTRPINFNDMI